MLRTRDHPTTRQRLPVMGITPQKQFHTPSDGTSVVEVICLFVYVLAV